MNDSAAQVLQFVQENDVKFIRLAFCDITGAQKNIAIMAQELPRAFEQGISFDSPNVKGLEGAGHTDLFLVPDCSTISILPWRPAHERVMRMFCDICYPDGSPFEAASRSVLRQAVQRAAGQGFICRIGTECEFYLFSTDEQGRPTDVPFDRGSYADISPLDKGENIRREICLALEDMGLMPESSHHEQGPGQNEVDFRYADALTAADNLVTFQSVVRAIAEQNGLYASFLPKPLPGQAGNGLHLHISLARGGKNLFENRPRHSESAESFIQGILDRIGEITVFLNPLTNSYRRFGSFEAPRFVTWSHQNRSQLIRIPASSGEANRMELRSPDPTCNPYLAFALLLHAGLDGIEQKRGLMPSCDCDPAETDALLLPQNLGQALERAQNSEFVARWLPEGVRESYFALKENEWRGFRQSEDTFAWEKKNFFDRV